MELLVEGVVKNQDTYEVLHEGHILVVGVIGGYWEGGVMGHI